MNRFLYCIATTLIIGMNSGAVAEEQNPPMPDALIGILDQYDETNTIKRLGRSILQVAPNGVLNEQSFYAYNQLILAKARATKMAKYLALDLDFDGVLTNAELQGALLRTTNQGRVDVLDITLLQLDADLDNDSKLTFDELRFYVVDTVKLGERRDSSLERARLLMWLDLDGDDQLTITEMARAVREYKNSDKN